MINQRTHRTLAYVLGTPRVAACLRCCAIPTKARSVFARAAAFRAISGRQRRSLSSTELRRSRETLNDFNEPVVRRAAGITKFGKLMFVREPM